MPGRRRRRIRIRHGFLVNAGGTTSGVIDVSYNIAHDNAGAGIIAGSLLESSRVIVRYNKVYSNSLGISSASYGRHEIAYNEVSNNASSGISVDFAPTSVHHNIITGNDLAFHRAPGHPTARRAPGLFCTAIR